MFKPVSLWIRLALMLVFAACGGDSGPTGPSTPTNPDTDGDGIFNSVDACPTVPETFNGWEDVDGCPDNTLDFYQAVRVDVEGFWQIVFAQESLVYQPISGFTSYSNSIATPCGAALLGNAFYCLVNLGVFYHRELLDGFMMQIGDAAPAVIVAHEVGHHVSNQLGYFLLRDLGFVTTKQIELQADCWAGGWVAFVANRAFLESGDLEEIGATLFAVGDVNAPWFNPNGHGTAEERGIAFLLGFISGAVDGCSDITVFPAFSITNGDQ